MRASYNVEVAAIVAAGDAPGAGEEAAALVSRFETGTRAFTIRFGPNAVPLLAGEAFCEKPPLAYWVAGAAIRAAVCRFTNALRRWYQAGRVWADLEGVPWPALPGIGLTG